MPPAHRANWLRVSRRTESLEIVQPGMVGADVLPALNNPHPTLIERTLATARYRRCPDEMIDGFTRPPEERVGVRLTWDDRLRDDVIEPVP
jgi:hypothetical protein